MTLMRKGDYGSVSGVCRKLTLKGDYNRVDGLIVLESAVISGDYNVGTIYCSPEADIQDKGDYNEVDVVVLSWDQLAKRARV